MSSELQRIAQELVAALDEMPRVIGYLHNVARRCRDNAAYVGGLSNNPAAQRAAVQLDEAAKRCEEAAEYLARASPKARGWAEQMVSRSRTDGPSLGPGQIRAFGANNRRSPEEGPGREDQAARRKSSTTADHRGSTRAKPKISPEVGQRIVQRLPTRTPGDKTRGIWIDDAGNEHDLISGEHEADYQAAQRFAEKLGLVRGPHKLSTAADVELKFAMLMRREGIRHAEIILNNRPCEGRLGCNRLLKLFLPDGGSLTIHGPDGFKKTYVQEKE
jgi:hypothetical protein